MRHVPPLLRRELGSYFLSPMAYLILLAFQVIAWLNFWDLVDTLARSPQVVSMSMDRSSRTGAIRPWVGGGVCPDRVLS